MIIAGRGFKPHRTHYVNRTVAQKYNKGTADPNSAQQRLTLAGMDSSITIRLDQATKDKLEKLAKKDGRTLSNYVRRVLEKAAGTTP